MEDKSMAAEPSTLRVGVIGVGGIARNIHLPALNDIDGIELVALCDVIRERAAAMAEQYRVPRTYTLYREMLETEHLDAVLVLVEPASLYHVVWNCLAAGVDTFMEKPPGITLFQAESLRRKAAESERILQVGFNRRYIPVVCRAYELVRAHTQVTQVEGVFFKYGSAAFDRGSLSSFESDTIHAVDLMRWMAGGVPEKAVAIAAQHDDVVANAWNGVCRFDNGVTGIIKANYRTGGRVHKFEVHGPGASAYIDLGFGGPSCSARVLLHHGKPQYSLAARGSAEWEIIELDGMELAGSDAFYRYYGYYDEDCHFFDCVRTRTRPETDIEDAVQSMRLADLFVSSLI
jgi:predicted dehydrogenase